MVKRIRVKGVPKPEPDVRLYVLALMELARQLQSEEAEVKGQHTSSLNSPVGTKEGEADD